MDEQRPPSHRWMRYATTATIAAAVIAFATLVAAVVFASAHIDFSFGDADGRDATRLSIRILFFGAVQGIFLYASMVAFLAEAHRANERLSRLFWPMFAVKVTIPAAVTLSAVQGFDLLAHDLVPHWHVLYAPSLRVAQNLVLVAAFLSLTWLHATLLRGWGWGARRVAWLVAGMFLATLSITIAAVEFARFVS